MFKATRSVAAGLSTTKSVTLLLAAVATLAGCSNSRPAAHSESTTTTVQSTTPPPANSGSSTSSTTAPAFPAVVVAALKAVGSTRPPLIAPRVIPLPPSVTALSATTSTTADSWSVDLYATPSPLAVNDPVLSTTPYGPSGPNHFGSFGASKSASDSAADAALRTEASNLDHDCRSQLSPVSLGDGITAQSCANGTGTTYIWTEGNWHIGVDTSNSNGPADTQLASQIVSFLHTAFLPAPSTVGVIAATATGGPQTTGPSSTVPGTAATAVTVNWAVGAITLHFADDLNALDGLKMAVSEASY